MSASFFSTWSSVFATPGFVLKASMALIVMGGMSLSEPAIPQQNTGQRGYFMQKDPPKIQKMSIAKESPPIRRAGQSNDSRSNLSASNSGRSQAPTRNVDPNAARNSLERWNWLTRKQRQRE